MFTVDVNFAKQREGDAVGSAAEGLNLLFTARLLAEELVAGNPSTLKPSAANCFCRSSSCSYCGVRPHFEATLTISSTLPAKDAGGFLAINGRHFGIQNVMLHSLSSMDKPVSGEGDPFYCSGFSARHSTAIPRVVA